MLDYAPDGLTGTVVWAGEATIDDIALLQLVAASKSAPVSRQAMLPGLRAFHPERISGFCAS